MLEETGVVALGDVWVAPVLSRNIRLIKWGGEVDVRVGLLDTADKFD